MSSCTSPPPTSGGRGRLQAGAEGHIWLGSRESSPPAFFPRSPKRKRQEPPWEAQAFRPMGNNMVRAEYEALQEPENPVGRAGVQSRLSLAPKCWRQAAPPRQLQAPRGGTHCSEPLLGFAHANIKPHCGPTMAACDPEPWGSMDTRPSLGGPCSSGRDSRKNQGDSTGMGVGRRESERRVTAGKRIDVGQPGKSFL